MGKRIDVVLLLHGKVFVIEFKSGEKKYLRADAEQVMDYALDLKYFHEESANAPIIPILAATKAKHFEQVLETSSYHDQVYTPIFSNASSISSTIEKVLQKIPGYPINLENWEKSNYQPTPTIIEAARTLYAKNKVEDITRTEASGVSIRRTTEYVKQVVQETKEANGKTICFVTGVPGAGKTLVGLNIAFLLNDEYQVGNNTNQAEAVYMSGNGPLVKVLQAALAKDKIAREKAEGKKKITKVSDAEREASSKVQGISDYRESMLHKIKTPIKEGQQDIEIDPKRAIFTERNGYALPEHITIFDEAQRCWNHAKLADWLKQQARGTERYGMIVSSKAARLRPMAIDIKRKINVVNWFLADKDNVSSSYFLEDTATEFDIQGLELDWTCVVWDGDLRYHNKKWSHHQFTSTKWNEIRQEQDQEYQENAYRVLLTRARQGMVICVPEGNKKRDAAGEYEDKSRKPEIYDGTYNYLKSLGIAEI